MNRRAEAHLVLSVLAPLGLVALACGTTPEPTSPEGIPLVAPPPARGGATTTEATSPAPAASSAQAAKQPSPSSGAPLAVIEGDTDIMTAVGYRGGKLKLLNLGAELSIPPGALADGLAFSFGAAPTKGPLAAAPPQGALGTPLKLTIKRVEGGETIGSAVTGATTSITSENAPFVLKLALTAKTKTANLAVGTPVPDTKKFAYKIYPSSSIEPGEPGKAVFQVPSLPGECVLQLTNAEPTEKR